MARLASEMSSVLGNLGADQKAPIASAEDISNMDKEMNEFTSAMEKQGVKPEDLLKAILGDAAGTAGQPEKSDTSAPNHQSSTQKPNQPESPSGEKESFEETIRRTMERMQASDSNATTAATNPTEGTNSEEDMLATLLKAMESGGGGASSGDPKSEDSLSKMFLGMMEQLTNKDMLYEPMKELDSKYPEWLADNKGKLPDEDYKRYEGQRGVVREIVTKFEEKRYSDEDSSCREFIWERMQKMQAMGSPPEDLIANPIPGMMGDPGGGGAGGGAPGEDAGCPTQ
jgi:peroxin-19